MKETGRFARAPDQAPVPTGLLFRPLRFVRGRLAGRPDTEHEQAIIRIVVICGMYAYMLLAPFPPEQRGFIIFWSTVLFAGGMSAALAIFAHILWQPKISPCRRVFGILVDTIGLNGAMLIGGYLTTPFYPLLLWVIFGHGFRYGNRYLFIAASLSLAMFGFVLLTNSELKMNRALDVALVLSLIVLPAYVSVLLKKLTRALARAEAASRAKSRFLATMSHEFRTPLNAILGTTELLEREASSPTLREGLKTVKTAAASLLGMVEALLRLARLEAGRVEINVKYFDLDALVARLLAMVRPTASAKNLDLRLQLDPAVPAFISSCEESLEHILLNLLANAVKFTHEGSVVLKIAMSGEADQRPWLRFEVRDTGIGIAEEARKRIFERFVQADEETRVRFGGSGLGLAIARELVELLGGSIGVESVVGRGSTFWVEVPISLEAEASPLVAPALGGVVVLGNALSALAVAERLEALGLRARVAATTDSVLDNLARLELCRAVLAVPPTAAADILRLREQLRSRWPGEPVAIIALGLDPSSAADLPLLAQLPTDVDDRTLLRVLRAALAAGLTPPSGDPEHSLSMFSGRAARILFADDNRVNQQVISRLLEHCGHEVEVVDNGQAVVERLEKDRFDLVIMDVNMPDMSGPDTVKLLRFLHDPASLPPIVALSADATPETRDLCLSLGFSRYLTKPVSRETLVKTIAELVPDERRSGRKREGVSSAGELRQEGLLWQKAPDGEAKVIPHPALARAEAEAVIDRTRLRQIAALDPDPQFVEGLVRDFLADGERLIAALKQAAESGDIRAWRAAAHALRSSASHIGANRLWARTREWRELDDHVLQLRARTEARAIAEEFQRTAEALQGYLRFRVSEAADGSSAGAEGGVVWPPSR